MEAKGSGYAGIKDVVDVMFNRVHHDKFPSTICSNLHKRGQYPWVKQGMPNRNSATYKEVLNIVEEIYVKKLLGSWTDGTGGATFFNNHGGRPTPKARLVMKRKGHYFFK